MISSARKQPSWPGRRFPIPATGSMPMLRKTRFPLLFFVCCVLWCLTSCTGKTPPPDPREAVTGYLEAFLSGSTEDLRSYLPPGHEPQPEMEAFETRFLRKYLARLASIQVEDISLSGDRAQARVAVTEPDVRTILREIEGALAPERFPENDLEALPFVSGVLGSLAVKYRKEGVPGRTYRAVLYLRREGDAWKIIPEGTGGGGHD